MSVSAEPPHLDLDKIERWLETKRGDLRLDDDAFSLLTAKLRERSSNGMIMIEFTIINAAMLLVPEDEFPPGNNPFVRRIRMADCLRKEIKCYMDM